MKKILVIAGVLLLIPFMAFGMEMLTDEVMDEVIGQAGVTIEFEGDTIITGTTYGISWGDPDGEATYTNPPGDGVPAYLRIDGEMTGTITIADGSFMTIDVEGSYTDEGTSAVIIGLENMDVSLNAESSTLTISANSNVNAAPDWTVAESSENIIGVLGLPPGRHIEIDMPTALIIRPH